MVSSKVIKLIWILIGGAIFTVTIVSVVAGGDEIKAEAKPDAKTEVKSPACLVDETALEDVKKAKERNESKAKELAAKEAELKAMEKNLSEQLSKLQSIRDEIAHIENTKKEESQAKLQQLTDTILTMSPKAAAKVLSTLDENLAVDIMLRMDNIRLAKIMNLMEPSNSSRLSERMAGVVKLRTESAQTGRGELAPIKVRGEPASINMQRESAPINVREEAAQVQTKGGESYGESSESTSISGKSGNQEQSGNQKRIGS